MLRKNFFKYINEHEERNANMDGEYSVALNWRFAILYFQPNHYCENDAANNLDIGGCIFWSQVKKAIEKIVDNI
jgi:hypothetical protein